MSETIEWFPCKEHVRLTFGDILTEGNCMLCKLSALQEENTKLRAALGEDSRIGRNCTAHGRTHLQDDRQRSIGGSMTDKDFTDYIRGFEIDHLPDGWPAIQMSELSRLLDMVDRYREALIRIVNKGDYRWVWDLVDIAREALEGGEGCTP